MKKAHSSFTEPQSAKIEAEAILQRAIDHCSMLKKAFHLCASRRQDAEMWRLLEHAVVAYLDILRAKAGPPLQRQSEWFAQTDGWQQERVLALLRRVSPKSGRASHYLRANRQIRSSAAGWSQVLDKATVAYWRHAAFVWMALWHIADLQDVTAEEAKRCLDLASRVEEAPALPLRAKTAMQRLSDAAGSFAAALRYRA